MDLQIDLEDFIKDNSKEINCDIELILSKSLYEQNFISKSYTRNLEQDIKSHIITCLNYITREFNLIESKIWLNNSTFETIVIEKNYLLQNSITIIKLIKRD